MSRKFRVTAKGIDRNNNIEGNITADGIITWQVKGNKRSTEKSVINYFKSDMSFLHVKVIEIVKVEEY